MSIFLPGPVVDRCLLWRLCGFAITFMFSSCYQYATSCPATLGGNFGRPPGSKLKPSMSVLPEGEQSEDETDLDTAAGPKSVTALSILESLAEQAAASEDSPAPDGEASGLDEESVESSADNTERRLTIEDDVFGLEGLEEVIY